MAIPHYSKRSFETIHPPSEVPTFKTFAGSQAAFLWGISFTAFTSFLEIRNPLRECQPLKLCGFSGGFSLGGFQFHRR